MLFQLREVPLEDLSPAALIGEPGLDPAQASRDGEVLLLQPLKPPVDLVEVPEDLMSQLRELAVDLGELPVHLRESPVDLGKPTVDLGEVMPQEFDELLVLT